MKYTIISTFLSFFISCTLNSCSGNETKTKRENIQTENKEIDDSSLEYKKFQTFKVPYGRDTILIGENGTKFFIDSGAIKTDIQVNLILAEYYCISDFLINNLTTTSNDKLLESKGMIYIDIVDSDSNSIEVDYSKIHLSFPTLSEEDLKQFNDSSEVFKIFYGHEGSGSINWIPDTTSMSRIIFSYGDVFDHYIYDNFFGISQLGWINCDKFIDGETLINCLITSDIEQFNQMTHYLVLSEYNSITSGHKTNVPNEIEINNIPKFKGGTLVSFSNLENNIISFSLKEIDITENLTIDHLEIRTGTLSDFETSLTDKFGVNL